MSKSILKGIKAIALDLDGVVYEGRTLVPGADDAVSLLRKNGLLVFFATNSSIKSREDITDKLTGMGIQTVKEEVFTSAYMAGNLIAGFKGEKRVLVVGMEGLMKEIIKGGAIIVNEPPCEYVVVGMDTSFSYDKICLSMDAIRNGAKFVACNRDANYPGEQGKLLPGCGPMVAAIETAAGISPHYLAGKPNTDMLKIISNLWRINHDEILVVGDNIQSDIKMAVDFGSPSVFIGSGELLANEDKHCRPTYVLGSLSDLVTLF